jgi:hypothetical protein
MAEQVQRDAYEVWGAGPPPTVGAQPRPPGQPVTVGAAQTLLLGPEALLRFDKKTVTLKNTGPQALATCRVQSTIIEAAGKASNVDADWEDLDAVTFATLASGAIKSVVFKDDSHKWWRIIATSAGSSGVVAKIDAAGAG